MNFELSTRRSFLKASRTSLVAASVAGLTLSNCGTTPASTGAGGTTPTSTGAVKTLSAASNDPLQRLLEGNVRFQTGAVTRPDQTLARRAALAQKQSPFAIIFSCVDSRVPPELVFDQGLGDLFIIRTAAHVLDSASLGSLEFGVAELHIPLLMVLGHERCGAVGATITAIDSHEEPPGSIKTLVDYIRPSVLAAQGTGAVRTDNAVRLNVSNTVQHLRQSTIMNTAEKSGKLTIVGARYDLDTGGVSIITH